MDALTIAKLIIEVGAPAAYKLWTLWRTAKEPTEADWQELLNLSEKTEADYVGDAETRRRGDAETATAIHPPLPPPKFNPQN